jgi:hypothetical protein
MKLGMARWSSKQFHVTVNAAERQKWKDTKMNPTKCPGCGVKLGNFLYADACPHCQEELKNNTRPLSAPNPESGRAKAWPAQMFSRLLRFVES